MGDLATDFVWSDTWVLLAIIYNQKRGSATLQDIIAAADGINHAIPTLEELESALNRLLAAGCITEQDGKYDVTEPVLMVYAKMTKPRQSVPDELDKMKQFLATSPRPESCPKVIVITDSAFKDACENYLKRRRD